MDNFSDNGMQQQPITHKVIRNTLYNTLSVFCISLFSLLLTPYIIRYIGIERFGVWAIVNVLIAYLGLLDFSMGNPVVKYVSEYSALKDSIKLNQLVNTAFVFYLLLAIAIAIGGLIFSYIIAHFFALNPALFKEALFVIKVGIISFSCFIFFSIFTSVLVGLQRMDTSSKILITGTIINFIGTVYVLKIGYGLRGLILNYLFITVLSGFLTSFIVFKRYPMIRFNILEFKSELFKKLLSFGLQLHLGKLAFLITFQMDKILLGKLLNINSVAFYELGSKITFTMRRLALLLVSAMVPVASEISVSRERSFFYDFYLRSSKYLMFVSAPLFLFGIFNAALIVTVWLGRVYAESISVIQILGFGYFVNVLTGVASTGAVGIGKPGIEMRYSLLVAPLNFILSIFLILKFGIVGAATATATSLIIGAIYYFKMFHNYLDKPPREIAYLLGKVVFVSLLSNILVVPLNYLAHYLGHLSPRISSSVILLIKWIIFCLIYIKIIFLIKFFDKQDLELARQRLPLINIFIPSH